MVDRIWRGLLWLAFRLPRDRRVAAMGWLFVHLVGPITGRSRTVRANLAYIYPEMSRAEIARITRAVLDNVGRMVIENYDGPSLAAAAARWQPSGPGWEEAEAARLAKRPIVVVSGHYGNYQAARAALNTRGYTLGALFRPLNNGFMNDHYIATLENVGGGAFSRDRKGLASFLRHFRNGGQGAILIDQFVRNGAELEFLGKPAPTTLTPADIALKTGALLLPVYAERLENGLDFRVEIEAPIPHGDPAEMMQAANDSLSARVSASPEQWFWTHRRWKPAFQARRRAARAPLEIDQP